MNSKWNTRRFKKITSDNLCNALKSISSQEQILVVQPKLLPVLNQLLTFTELTKSTPVRKIALLDEQLKNDLPSLLGTIPSMELVFLIDVRVDLCLPNELVKLIKDLQLTELNVLYCTWKTEMTNNLKRLTHFIKSQLENLSKANLFEWDFFPFAQQDDNLLVVNVLYNEDGENLYYPKRSSMEKTTRGILLDNMSNCIKSLLAQTNTIVTDAIAMGSISKNLVALLHDQHQTDENLFIKETLYGSKYHSSLETDLIVLERNVDPITPLLTQLSYVGILDDFFEFGDDCKLKDKEFTLDYITDDTWNELKFLNFGSVGPQLNKMAKDLQSQYDSRHNAETVNEIKNFVDSLGSLQQRQKLLKKHTNLSSNVLEEVEQNENLLFNRILELEQDILLDKLSTTIAIDKILELVYESDVQPEKILRLVCLLSITKNFLKDKDFENLQRELVDSFGVNMIFQLERLIRNRLLKNKSTSQTFEGIEDIQLKKNYRYPSLWLDTLPDETSNDANFAYCGMVPLTYRLIQLLYDRTIISKHYSSQQPFMISKTANISKLNELFENLYGNGNLITEEKWVPTKKVKHAKNENSPASNDSNIAIIVFLGGITLSEFATLRVLQDKLHKKNVNKRFIVIADGLTNGTRLIRSFM
ncbi:hypothetical protein KAFR_0A05900 [Kazachstania africana CBS 2517]|uniref:Sec1-like protein n=1 Tax=Kazachstania africana (strain ATCC 22294 / BCRC 22015 / CBS 2517 / CECT 1963 / NBRC 1671 / NRRL Y-8276) TaxID=1071382 RepID=H2ANS5_KAZAF|nr:hypothetical protein KAFR_0A05900 [Kazachstania africana CBS 2517]CCF56025.1 hypothetical protein KAFR_0A05900 [Kazachstania africana CBS 2517]